MSVTLNNMRNFEIPGTVLKFPQDEGIHEDVKHEWWYFNGHVYDKKGLAYGLMVCFFNHGKLYVGITDEDNNKHYSNTFFGNLKAANDRLHVSIDNNWWIEKQKNIYQLHIELAEIRLDLDMAAERPPLLVGGQGMVVLGNGGVSYYYSHPRLGLNGKLVLLDTKIDVSGIGWIDRQWGNWDFNGFNGWEWFSIHLDNGMDIHLSKYFHPYTDASITPMLNIMHGNGEQETLYSYELEYMDYWIHPETRDRFSHGWRIMIPEKNIVLDVIPTINNQLLHEKLWEGSCNVVGKVSNKAVKGRAYVEIFLRKNKKIVARIAKLLISLTRA